MSIRNIISELRLYICNHIINKIPSHDIRLWFYRRIMGFQIGEGNSIFLGCRFDCKGGLKIANNSVINGNCRLDTRGGIEIGQNVSISEEVIILTADHDMNTSDFTGRNKKVTIEDYVWIGTRAMILPGVKIGRGAMVAAGAVVTKDADSFSVIAGIPAKKINKRPENLNYQASYRRLFK